MKRNGRRDCRGWPSEHGLRWICGLMSEGTLSLLCLLVALTPAAQALAADVEPAVENKVELAFEPADLGESTYQGWIHDRMQINVDKRLLQLDLDMILDPFVNRPGSQWWVGEHMGKYLHAATYAWLFTGDERLRKRMDYAVTTLLEAQLPNGYLGTYEEDDQFGWGDGLGWDGPSVGRLGPQIQPHRVAHLLSGHRQQERPSRRACVPRT